MSELTRLALMLVVAILIYANTIRNSFVFDDEVYITGNRQVTDPTLHGLFSAPTNNVFRPITFFAFALETIERAVSMTYKSDFNYRIFSIFLAVQLVKMNRDDEALKILNGLISQWPDYSRAWYTRVAIEYRQRNITAARADTETAVRLEPTFAQAQRLLNTLNAAPEPALEK